MRKHRCQVDTSVGVSGPHDFAVRPLITRQLISARPSHPAPDVRDDREAPLLVERGTAETSAFDLPDGTSGFFWRQVLLPRANHPRAAMLWVPKSTNAVCASDLPHVASRIALGVIGPHGWPVMRGIAAA